MKKIDIKTKPKLFIHDYRIEAIPINWKKARELYKRLKNR